MADHRLPPVQRSASPVQFMISSQRHNLSRSGASSRSPSRRPPGDAMLSSPAILLLPPPRPLFHKLDDNWQLPKPPLRPETLIDKRELLLQQVREFALDWHRAYLRADEPAALARVVPHARSPRAYPPPQRASDPNERRRAGMPVQKLPPPSQTPPGLRTPRTPLPQPPATPSSCPLGRQQQQHSPRMKKALESSPLQPRPDLNSSPATSRILPLDEAQRLLAAMLGELALCTTELVEALAPSPWMPPMTKKQAATAAEAAAAAAAEAGVLPAEGGEGGGVAKQYRVLSERWVQWALLPADLAAAAAGGSLAHPPAGIRTGVNYLLQVLIDFHRLPVPTASDPLCLRWFDEEDHPHFLARAVHCDETIARMNRAELALRSMLPVSHMKALRRLQGSPVGRSDEAWRAVAFLLYKETGGYVARLRWVGAKQHAAAHARCSMMHDAHRDPALYVPSLTSRSFSLSLSLAPPITRLPTHPDVGS